MQFSTDLTQGNVNNLLNGRSIQLKKEQLHGKQHSIVVHPTTHKRLSKAKMSGKGVRLEMTPDEFKASVMHGQGFMDILRGIKKGAEWIKNNIIDSSFYQQNVKPVVRQALEGVVSALPVPTPVKNIAEAGVSKLGEVTGAFGLEQEHPSLVMSQPIKTKKVRIAKPKAKPSPKPKAKSTSKPKPKPKPKAGSFLM